MEHFQFGVVCRKKGNTSGAINAFEQCLGLKWDAAGTKFSLLGESPSFSKRFACRYNLASSYVDAKSYVQARILFEDTIREIQELHGLAEAYGAVLLIDEEAVLGNLRKLCELSSSRRAKEFPLPAAAAAAAQLCTGDFVANLIEALKSSENSAEENLLDIARCAFTSLGGVYLKLGEALESIRVITLAISARKPGYAEREDWYNMNIALRQLGRQQLALQLSAELMGERVVEGISATCCWLGGSSSPPDSFSRRAVPPPPRSPPLQALPLPVNIICIKYGTKYGPAYVNRLFEGVHRNIDIEDPRFNFRFICFTDDHSGIEEGVGNVSIKPLPARPFSSSFRGNPAGWWYKARLFDPSDVDLNPTTNLVRNIYIDLDTIVTGDLTKLIEMPLPSRRRVKFATLTTDGMENESRSGGLNTSVMVWEASECLDPIFTTLNEHFSIVGRYIYKLDHWFEMCLSGVAHLIQGYDENLVREFKSVVCSVSGKGLPDNVSGKGLEGTALVTFPLSPKPHECKEIEWVMEYWTGFHNNG